MPSSINASTTAGVVTTADTSGVLNIQTAGTTAISIDASQAVSFTNAPTVTGGTANGVAYLNGSKVLTTGSALVFNGTSLGVGVTPSVQYSGIKSLQVGSTTNLFDNGASTKFYHNAYTAASGDETYLTTGYAQGYLMASNGQHQWYTAASGTAGATFSFTQAMTLDASGNLLVGTTSNTNLQNNNSFLVGGNLPGAGSACFNGTNGNTVLQVNQTLDDDAARGQIYFYRNESLIGSITSSNTTTAFNNLSDYRLKHDIQTMTGALAKVALLKPCTYKWNADGSDGEGFVAHELAEVCPHAVTGEKDAVETQQYEISPAVPATFDEDGNELTPAVEAVIGEREVPKYQGVDTSFLVATLTAAIQEQQALITQLQADVAALKGA
jgi:hypothetical protein